jgi:hypothetical protein
LATAVFIFFFTSSDNRPWRCRLFTWSGEGAHTKAHDSSVSFPLPTLGPSWIAHRILQNWNTPIL